MAKKSKLRPTKEVIREIFPDEIVNELDRIIREVDEDVPTLRNPYKPGARPIKPWAGKWAKGRKRGK